MAFTHSDWQNGTGSACDAGDKPAENPAACGTACGAGNKPVENPSVCGSACGTDDKK